jgi:hypothetical protein
MAGLQRHPDDASAPRLHDLAADDGVLGPVGAFDQHVRLNRRDEIAWGGSVEDDHGVDAAEGFEDFGALRLCRDRTLRSFDLTDRSVGVQADEQRASKVTRVLEIAQVANVQEIEDAVGENDRLSSSPQAFDESDGIRSCMHGARRLQPSGGFLNCTAGEKVHW